MRCQAGVTPADAGRVGEALARVHEAGGAEVAEKGRFELDALETRLDRIGASGDPRFAPMVPALRDTLRRTQASRDPGLPAGLMHGDLFRDNVLWDASGEVSALLDFESACQGTFTYDLMVAALYCNDVGLYNRFVVSFQRELQDSDAALLGYFQRTGGRAGTSEYHSYKTMLANNFSLSGLHGMQAYCSAANTAFDAALNPEGQRSLASFISTQRVDTEGYAACETTTASDEVVGGGGSTRLAAGR